MAKIPTEIQALAERIQALADAGSLRTSRNWRSQRPGALIFRLDQHFSAALDPDRIAEPRQPAAAFLTAGSEAMSCLRMMNRRFTVAGLAAVLGMAAALASCGGARTLLELDVIGDQPYQRVTLRV